MKTEKLTDLSVIRKTTSRCVECGKIVDAAVVVRDGKVFLEKYCLLHLGQRQLLSEYPEYYRDLENYFFSVMQDDLKQWAVEIDITFRCNMACPICAWGKDKVVRLSVEPSLEEITEFLKHEKAPVIRLSGGEPTCRNDLFDIIKRVKSFKRKVIVNTNGLKLEQLDYVQELKRSGVDTINVSLDGFDEQTEIFMRGENYLPIKKQALNNLKKAQIPTGLNIRIGRGVNEEAVSSIIDYAVKNPHVKLLSFGTIGWLGNAQDYDFSTYLVPDQLVDIVARGSSGKITRDGVRLFQKLFIALNSFFSQRWCFYDSAATIILRDGDTYYSLDKYIDLLAIEKKLDRYAVIYKKNTTLAKIYLVFAGIYSLTAIRSLKLLKELFVKGVSFFRKGKGYLNSESFLYVSFNTCCDNCKIDYQITQNCIFAMAFKTGQNPLKIQGSGAEICDSVANGSKKNNL